MIYLIHGPEQFLVFNHLANIFKQHNITKKDIFNIDGQVKDFSIKNLESMLSQQNLFIDQPVFLIKNSSFLKNKVDDKQLTILEKILNSDQTIFFYTHDYTYNRNLKSYKLIKKYAQEFYCDILDKKQYFQIVKQFCINSNLKLFNDQIEYLISKIPQDLLKLKKELLKLKIYGETIDEQIIDCLISPSITENNFILVNALLEKNVDSLLKAINDLFILNINYQVIISLMATQIRFMFSVNKLMKNNSFDQIIKKLKINSYRLTQTTNIINKFKKTNYLKCLSLLKELDVYLKNDLYCDHKTLITIYLIKIMKELK